MVDTGDIYLQNPIEPSANEDSDETREYFDLKDEYERLSAELHSTIHHMAELGLSMNALPPDEVSYVRDLQIRRRRTKDLLDQLKLDLEAQNMGGFI